MYENNRINDMKRNPFILAGLLLTCLLTKANGQNCSCSDLLKEVISKTQGDYAGYIHKVVEKDSGEYIKLKADLAKKAINTSFYDCHSILEKYAGFFHDGHLSVGEFPPKQPDSLAAGVKHVSIPANFESALLKNRSRDSIEGTWKGANHLQLAIFKTGKNKFTAVVQKTNTPKWAPGMVKMEIEKTGPNEYNVALYRDDFAKVHFSDLHISKNTMLGLGFNRFAKAFPVNPEQKYIDYNDPLLPVLKVLDKNNVLLTIPSALIDGRYLDSILAKNDAVIKSTPNLIIDIRNNGGGNFIWGSIYDIANTIVKAKPDTSKEDDFLLMASEDDAKYIDRLASYTRQKKDSAGIRYYDNVIAKIRSNTGKIIGFSFYSSGPDTATRQVFEYPKHIAVIMDKAVASAGEAFVMGIKSRSSKVTFYGTNTYGMIDYMNVNSIPIGDKSCRWYYFSYPTFFSKTVKTNPVNPTGLKPDIYVPQNNPDWIEWVKNDLAKK
jgi:hypothetical protein